MFDRTNPAAADAEVFALFAGLLSALPLRAATGDIGILVAAVQGLKTSQNRRAALQRHIWRPHRFRALLDRFGGRTPASPSRRAMLASFAATPAVALIAGAGGFVGLRSEDEIAARIASLLEDAALRLSEVCNPCTAAINIPISPVAARSGKWPSRPANRANTSASAAAGLAR